MKKFYLFLVLAIASAMLFSSCEKGGGESEYSAIVEFENAGLLTHTGGNALFFDNILWGKEQAVKVSGADNSVFDGIIYSEDGLDFCSYYNDLKNVWGEGTAYDTFGGFAISSNYSLEEGGGYSRQFHAYASGSSKFAVAFDSGGFNGGKYETPTIEFQSPKTVLSAKIANNNYAYWYCANNPKGAAGEMDIEFRLVVKGYNGGAESGSFKVALAEGANVLADWKTVDFSSLGSVDKIVFSFESNDVGEYGNNIPAYFCIDDIKIR